MGVVALCLIANATAPIEKSGGADKIGSDRLEPILGSSTRRRTATAPKTLARFVERRPSSNPRTCQKKRAPEGTLSCLARPRGFEPLTPAFGGYTCIQARIGTSRTWS